MNVSPAICTSTVACPTCAARHSCCCCSHSKAQVYKASLVNNLPNPTQRCPNMTHPASLNSICRRVGERCVIGGCEGKRCCKVCRRGVRDALQPPVQTHAKLAALTLPPHDLKETCECVCVCGGGDSAQQRTSLPHPMHSSPSISKHRLQLDVQSADAPLFWSVPSHGFANLAPQVDAEVPGTWCAGGASAASFSIAVCILAAAWRLRRWPASLALASFSRASSRIVLGLSSSDSTR